jgi:magnesium-transporting ATPase (P-type)
MHPSSSAPVKTRFAGIVLAACTISMIVAISHHPVAPARRGLQALEAITQLGAADRAVHATLIVIIFAMLFSFTVYTLSRSRLQISVVAWVAFFAGSMSVIVAALTDGFFVPAFAERYLHSAPLDAAPGLVIINAAAVVIQVATRFGFLSLTAATLLWSIDLLFDRSRARLIGLLGIIVAMAVTAMLLFAGTINVHSLLLIVGLQAVWYLAISYQMAASLPPERGPTLV